MENSTCLVFDIDLHSMNLAITVLIAIKSLYRQYSTGHYKNRLITSTLWKGFYVHAAK